MTQTEQAAAILHQYPGRETSIASTAARQRESPAIDRTATNPKNIKIVELEAPQLPRALDDCDASVINGGYAVSAKLDPKTAIATEDDTSPYINIIATRAKDKDNPTYKKFVKIFQSPKTKKYIEDNYADTLVPAF